MKRCQCPCKEYYKVRISSFDSSSIKKVNNQRISTCILPGSYKALNMIKSEFIAGPGYPSSKNKKWMGGKDVQPSVTGSARVYEDPVLAAEREVREELGINADGHLKHILEHKDGSRIIHHFTVDASKCKPITYEESSSESEQDNVCEFGYLNFGDNRRIKVVIWVTGSYKTLSNLAKNAKWPVKTNETAYFAIIPRKKAMGWCEYAENWKPKSYQFRENDLLEKKCKFGTRCYDAECKLVHFIY